ncbi:MAG TPA: DoxX family membrane protein [Chloroflexota bacterium]|jgi:thiosulfate dehydrogenase [quinone] large subunit|nr:DoxX family membrane protein [Chloroflexota bacterium]
MATILTTPRETQVPDPPLARFLFADARMAPFWTIIRLYVGWQWLSAGWGKLTGAEAGWVGAKAGAGMAGFVAGALKNGAGAHPSVQPYYAWFLQHFVQPYPGPWAYAITFGEILVGLGLIVGLFTGIAAFFGGLLNANYLLAGAVSTNPALFILATGLVLAWKVAGLIGLDYAALPLLGVPGAPGKLFRRPPVAAARQATSA